MTLENSEGSPQPGGPSRRTILGGVAAVGVVGVSLSSCSGGGTATGTGGRVGDNAGKGGSPERDAASKKGGITAKTADVPAGGGKVLDSDKVVVTQPEAGQFKAFSAVCTHQGCIVAEVASGTINCPCHGSKFDITDGSARSGPATKPLAQKKVSVEGDRLIIS